MATYNKGILGAFSGKVGTVVGATWRGMDVLRSLPKKKKHIPSERQLLQQMKFTTVTDFLTPLKPVTSLYFGTPTGELSRYNLAMSYHLKEAVAYNGVDYDILYNKVQLTKGDLLSVQNLAASAIPHNLIRLTWANNAGQGSAKPNDRLVVVVYEPMSGLSEMFLQAGTRQDEFAEVLLQPFFNNTKVECWIGFAAENGKKQSTSVYVGSLNVV